MCGTESDAERPRMPTETVTERFQRVFNNLNSQSLHLVDELYSHEVFFIDPIHEVRGVGNLRRYFGNLYQNVELCQFDFHACVEGEGQAMLSWTMKLKHRTFRPGELVEVPGASLIRFREQVDFHQDYFDVGRLIYERVPLLGGVIRRIKARL